MEQWKCGLQAQVPNRSVDSCLIPQPGPWDCTDTQSYLVMYSRLMLSWENKYFPPGKKGWACGSLATPSPGKEPAFLSFSLFSFPEGETCRQAVSPTFLFLSSLDFVFKSKA